MFALQKRPSGSKRAESGGRSRRPPLARSDARPAAPRAEGLPAETRRYFEPRFGHSFADVRVHTGGEADRAARALGARAFTRGRDVVFAAGEYAPASARGRRLLAHELTHVVQQTSATPPTPDVQREDGDDDAKLTGKVTMLFNGEELIVSEDGKEVMRTGATSGRPTNVKAAHAKKCKGSTKETYVNNPRYVGITDHGAIPEGKYKFRASRIQTFTEAEQVELIDAARRGKKNISVGTPKTTVHTGDWGRGRVHLLPNGRPEKGPKPCEKTSHRSGFFLHGGILRGSAGCIDIGSLMDDLAARLKGNKKQIDLEVDYKKGAKATLSECEILFGRVMYDKHEPDPIDFIRCFTELRDAADKEAQSVWDELRNRVLKEGLGLGTGSGTSTGGPSLGDMMRSLLGGDED